MLFVAFFKLMFGVRIWFQERTRSADVLSWYSFLLEIGKDIFKNSDKKPVLLFDGKLELKRCGLLRRNESVLNPNYPNFVFVLHKI